MIWTEKALKEKGYDGLYDPDNDCACTVEDLRPCGCGISETLGCKPGVRYDHDEYDFCIGHRDGRARERGNP